MTKRHILIDACLAAALYAPRTTRSATLLERARKLLTGTSTSCEPQFLIPNFCIGETFAVFEKYRWGASWNRHVNQNTRLGVREFNGARKEFHADIHNARKMLQVELDRYHVLCLDLIAPINAAYRIQRDRGRRRNVTPASTYDLLFIAMGIWLQRQLGAENFVMATGDERIALVLRRAKSVHLGRPMNRHLTAVANRIGLVYGPEVYPTVVDLGHARQADLRTAFPGWSPNW